MKLKVGDKVKVLAEYSGFYQCTGYVSEALSNGLKFPYTVVFDADNYSYFEAFELELIS